MYHNSADYDTIIPLCLFGCVCMCVGLLMLRGVRILWRNYKCVRIVKNFFIAIFGMRRPLPTETREIPQYSHAFEKYRKPYSGFNNVLLVFRLKRFISTGVLINL